MEGVWNGVGNEFLTISLPTSVGVPANKCSLYLVCITGIFGLVKIQIITLLKCYFFYSLASCYLVKYLELISYPWSRILSSESSNFTCWNTEISVQGVLSNKILFWIY